MYGRECLDGNENGQSKNELCGHKTQPNIHWVAHFRFALAIIIIMLLWVWDKMVVLLSCSTCLISVWICSRVLHWITHLTVTELTWWRLWWTTASVTKSSSLQTSSLDTDRQVKAGGIDQWFSQWKYMRFYCVLFWQARYGGHGYCHILQYVMPKMKSRGISEDVVQRLVTTNPQRWLTFH